MPDYLFTSQFESIIFFSCKSKNRRMREKKKKKKKKKTIPAPEDQMVDPLAILYMVNCTVCQDIEKVACEHPSRHDPETNQHTYLFMPQNWSLEIVTSCTTTRKALRLIMRLPAIFNHSVRFLNMFKNLPATDFDREIVRDR